ncbi:hypothetical protein CTAYLR_009546 [Chrysophaeum taylorii]|uniref:Uncharacterized protein n=1 Tax=Chrysophaeum taylorii TaxID=2483200 RepID=A0AAD7UK13_9STRA|nr:hypothetical protein CTAYLR_009546 [Chrysophaeum taylorii]
MAASIIVVLETLCIVLLSPFSTHVDAAQHLVDATIPTSDSSNTMTHEVTEIVCQTRRCLDELPEARSFDEKIVITTTADGAQSVAAADLDGDADLDVLSASAFDDTVAWYRNDDGTFAEKIVITTTANGANSVAAADLDGDDDLDVLSASWSDVTVAWYRNDNGTFAEKIVITTTADGARFVAAADLDGDADVDVLSASSIDDTVAWYRNDDGTFEEKIVITTTADSARSVAAADLDGDADLDVLSASSDDDTVAWYRNDDGTFAEKIVITTTANGANSVAAADLDGDDDLDVLSASWNDDTVAWYRNDDGTFAEKIAITTTADGARSVAAADLDGDADLDVLSASFFDDTVAWYRNDDGTFAGKIVITTTADYAYCVAAADLDGDADLDVLSASYYDDTVACLVVLIYIYRASKNKNKNLARILFTIILSQFDYGSDTLFVGYQNFVTPTLFVASCVVYLFPLALFLVIHRGLVAKHLHGVYASSTKSRVRFEEWNEMYKVVVELGSFCIFVFVLGASIFTYLLLLFVFISCKLMSVSFFATAFFKAAGEECTDTKFQMMFKTNVFIEMLFESTGELVVAIVDAVLRSLQKERSYEGLSSWALLSIVGGVMMLLSEIWPYVYRIAWERRGIRSGIEAVNVPLEFTPDEVIAPRVLHNFSWSAVLSIDKYAVTHSEVQKTPPQQKAPEAK